MSRRIGLLLLALLIAAPAWGQDFVYFKKKAAAGGTPTQYTKIISANTTGTYTGDYSGVVDTQVKTQNATTNYDTATTVETTKYASNNHTHMLIKFTGLSNIPATATIDNVVLGLYENNAFSFPSGYTVSMKMLLRDWVYNQVTWNIYSTGNNWTTAGAISDVNDRAAWTTASKSGITDVAQWYTWTSAQLITDVQLIVNGTNANYGWHFERTDAADDSKYLVWRTSEIADGTRPYISVTYTVVE